MNVKTTKVVKRWLKDNWKLSLVLILLVGGGSAFAISHNPGVIGANRNDRDTQTQKEEPPKPTTLPAPLTGVEVEPKVAKRPVTAVMIENSPGARPQTGLDSAGIVFEAVAEGGITRFLALYQDRTPGKIGPIRSIRPYFVDWFMGFDAAIAHVGGSAKALQMVKNRNAKDLDQFKHNGPYYRGGGRPAPHNMYSSIKSLRDLQNRLGYKKSKFKEIARSDDNPSQNPGATNITINYSSQQYQAQFRYQKSSNNYSRRMAGAAHKDTATGKPITVKNVVLVHMPTTTQGRYAVMENIGSGKAVVFKNGQAKKAKWKQASPRDRMEVLDNEGKQVPLNRGDTWFAILPSNGTVTY